MASLYVKLDEVYKQANIHNNTWLGIIDEFGTAYHNAADNLKNNLPLSAPAMSDLTLHGGLMASTTGLLFAVAGPPALIRFFIAPAIKGVDSLIERIGTSTISASALGRSSTFVLSPREYKTVYSREIRGFFNEVMTRTLDAQRAAARKQSVSITQAEFNNIQNLIKQTPYWHEPAGYREWTYNVIEPEIEKNLWAVWAKSLSLEREKWHHRVPAVASYNFVPVLKRLTGHLKVNLGGEVQLQNYEAIESAFGGMPVEQMRMQVVRDLKKWGETYVPDKEFGSPVPAPVREYWRNVVIEKIGPYVRAVPFLNRIIDSIE